MVKPAMAPSKAIWDDDMEVLRAKDDEGTAKRTRP
jgi:hypothetical protein